jgi:RecA-family ATPase
MVVRKLKTEPVAPSGWGISREHQAERLACEYLRVRGITLETFHAAGGEVVADAERINPRYGRGPALVWHFFDPHGSQYSYQDGERSWPFHRVRLLGYGKQFLQPEKSGTHVYFARHPKSEWPLVLADPHYGVVITEGETRALAGIECDLPVISLTGVDCGQKNGKLHPDLEGANWQGRLVYLAFDSDASRKKQVESALHKLAAMLQQRGAEVWQVHLPAAPDGSKQGLDDYLARYGKDAFDALRESAETVQISNTDVGEPPLSLANLISTAYPPIEWVWKDFVLKGEVNLLYGDGGVGKSLLALYICVAAASGRPLLNNATIQMPVIALFAEDNPAQVQLRANKILIELGLDAKGDLPMRLWCQPSGDTALAIVDDNGVVAALPRLQALRDQLVEAGRPALVILDSMADLFAMNENLRLPVNAALKQVLGSLCRDFGATVLVLAHPSKASMLDGTNYSGSTAFNNGVRHRLNLAIEKRGAEEMQEGPPPRRLSIAKSNYGAAAEKLLYYYGPEISELPRAAAITPEEEANAVLQAVLGMIDRGIRIVRGNGNGQKPRDVAIAVKEKFGIIVAQNRVTHHLSAFERSGMLSYVTGDKNKRPATYSGFVRGPKCTR